ncbi:DUF2017 family protein [Leifsonia sp. PS1209]|uniref:DUF2017 family protein n=1 Tax=Leifsonia sp. PS1209 TaxID=2724914 RepID=UPI001442E2B7|nr:DUF2017 family protein [Leifsonia sp. PS1209]QIZ98445.1 DUF2017 family protein [Leifsonia sp. PS1209]
MKPFRRSRDGAIVAVFEREEAEIIARLASESAELVEAVRSGVDPASDPALLRLLPDAYPDDAEASVDFRRFTTDGLAERKALNAVTVVEALSAAGGVGSSGGGRSGSGSARGRIEVRLDAQEATAWMRAIGDIRLVLASRLGIVEDGDDGDVHDDETALLRAIYDWLAFVQDTLVGAVWKGAH